LNRQDAYPALNEGEKMKTVQIYISVMATVALLQCQETRGAITVPEGYMVEVYATSNNIGSVKAIDFDPNGNLYVAYDEGNTQIRRISPGGSPITSWGPMLDDPDNLAADAYGNVYVGSESQGLYRISPDGSSAQVTTTYMGNNYSMCIDIAGTLGTTGAVYVGNARHSADIAKHNPSSGSTTVFASSSLLYTFSAMAVDDVGFLYAAEYGSGHAVLRIDASGGVTNFAAFNNPFSMVFHKPTRQLYVGDLADESIYRLGLDGIKTVFASGVVAHGLAFGPDGYLYIADQSTNPDRILRIRHSSVETWFGEGELLEWNSTSGRVYEVEFKTNLVEGAWVPLEPQVTANTTNTTTAISFTNAPVGFFRVVRPEPEFF